MTLISRLADGIRHAPLIRTLCLFWIFPVFLLQLCLYLNVNNRPGDYALFTFLSLFVFFILSMLVYALIRAVMCISRAASEKILCFFDIFFIMVFTLSVFFPVQHVLLDGQKFAPVPAFDTVKQFAVPVLLLLVVFFSRWKRPDEFSSVKILLSCACIFFIAYSAISISLNAPKAASPAKTAAVPSCELGKRNVILLILETLQGSYLEELATESPELFSAFSAVTLFPRAVTSIPYSPLSTVQLFSGAYSWDACNDRAEAVATLDADSLLTDAHDKGYRFSGGKYTPVPGGTYVSVPEEGISLRLRLPLIILTHSKYYFASIRRIVPALAWPLLQKAEDKIYGRYLLSGQYPSKMTARDDFVSLTRCLRVGDTNAFLYFFNYMTHREILFDRSGNPIPGLPQNKETQKEEYRYALSLYADFFAKLKSIGVYDDSLIILTGDHGAYDAPGQHYNPAVLLKPPHAPHVANPLAVSPVNMRLTDIRPLIEAYMRSDEAFHAEFGKLLQKTGPRDMRVYTHMGGTDPEAGKNWQRHDIFGTIEEVIQSVVKK